MFSIIHLPEHKFKHNFQNTLNSIYKYRDKYKDLVILHLMIQKIHVFKCYYLVKDLMILFLY